MDIFYRLNPKKVQRYQPYMLEWAKHRNNQMSASGWMNGVYVAKAIGTSMSKKAKYPTEPINFWASEEDEVITDADRFEAWAMAFNSAFKAKSDAIADAGDIDE